jgi:hypothetical protein
MTMTPQQQQMYYQQQYPYQQQQQQQYPNTAYNPQYGMNQMIPQGPTYIPPSTLLQQQYNPSDSSLQNKRHRQRSEC